MNLEEIKSIFSNVNNWVTYADIKIGVLLTFDAAFLISLIERYSEISSEIFALFVYSIFLLIIAIIFLLLAGFPIMSNIFIKILDFPNRKKTDYNLIFYKDIARLNQNDYINMIQKKYNFVVQSLEKDYLKEISINSKIATYKFLMSRISFIITILCICIVSVLLLKL